MSMPLVSIVIPAFDHARYLSEAIDSVLQQSYRAVELIILDDGSTDETPNVLARYASAPCYIERHPNMGQARTLNKGWGLSQGEYLGYLSADDRLTPTSLAASVDVLESHPEAVGSYGDYELLRGDGTVFRQRRCPAFDRRRVVREAGGQSYLGPGMLFRRTALEAVGGWDARYRREPDANFLLSLICLGSLVRVDAMVGQYRVHEGSITVSPSTRHQADEPIRIVDEFFARDDLDDEVLALRGAALASAHWRSALVHGASERLRTSSLRAARALAYAPSGLLSLGPYRALGCLARCRFRRRQRVVPTEHPPEARAQASPSTMVVNDRCA